MKRSFLILLLILIFLAPIPTSAESKQLVALGDSIPYGYHLPSPSDQSFPSLIAKEKGWKLTNLSKPGMTSTQLLAAIKHEEEFQQALKEADIVVLYIGGNDLLNLLKENKGLSGLTKGEVGKVSSKLIRNLSAIMMELNKRTDAKVLLYNLYNPYPDAGFSIDLPLDYINMQYATVAELLDYVMDVKVIDASKAFHKHPEYLIIDDVHPTIIGQHVLADLGLSALS
ncbi:SGNH/GDSL hydrolase family protein [Halobacillus salinus]|uniref:SGNH/GDSL hydrolase family protein n=1 Tax=Halobacillus salinus TaxID=192814 RepID=UPI0009A8D9B0|nr:GDSL-type esterase/lipase family protein [Halobacillus salinus]